MSEDVQRVSGVITKIEEINSEIRNYEISFKQGREAAFCFAMGIYSSCGEICRPYTPVKINKECVVCPIKIYKQEGERKMLTPLVGTWKEGDSVDILWYRKKLPILEMLSEKHKTVFMISAGTGVTPMMQMLFYADANRMRNFKFVSVCLNKNETYRILRSCAEYPGLDLEIVDLYTQTEKGSRERSLMELRLEVEKIERETAIFCVSGPNSFVEAVSGPRKQEFGGMLKIMGVLDENCFKF